MQVRRGATTKTRIWTREEISLRRHKAAWRENEEGTGRESGQKNAVGKERTEGKRSTPTIRQKEKTSNRNYSLLAGDVRRPMVLVAATSPSYSASTTTVDRRAYFAELQVQLSSCHSYKAMKRVIQYQLPYKFILNQPSSSAALLTHGISATLLACITSVTRRIFAQSKYGPMETNYIEQEALYLPA